MIDNLFTSIGVIIVIATFFAYIARLFKQPFILAYIITGIIIGPVLGLITNSETIATLSEIGIAFLLFIVGLEIDLKKLKNVAVVSSLGGIIQILILFTLGYIISMFFGFVNVNAVYIGLILAFSSTMVVVKLLSDKKEVDTLHGRIIIGFLLMEDFFAILALSILSTSRLSFYPIAMSLLKFMIFLFVSFVIVRFLIKKVMKFAAKSQELFFLVSVGLLFLFSLFALYLNISIIIGSFIAGVVLGNLPYNIEIKGKVKSLKDFFSTIFFVSLGLELSLTDITDIIKPLIIFIIFIAVCKPVLTMFLCSFFGYRKRPSFLTAISLAQISEFSLIIVTQGLLLGHIGQGVFSLAVIIAIVTMTITSYTISFDNKLYLFFSKYIGIFDRIGRKSSQLEYVPKRKDIDVILCGFNRIGYSIYRVIKKLRKRLLVIDYNPEIVRDLIKKKIPCIYGDIGDLEVVNMLNLKEIKMLISTVPDKYDNLMLIRKAKGEKKNTIIFVTASQVDDALELYDAGADYVILPHFLGGEHASVLIEEFGLDINKIFETKLSHIRELKHRKSIGHEHPMHH